MSVGPLHLPAAVAGAPLAQTKGSELERAAQDNTTQQRQTRAELQAERAAGIGETDGENTQANERDADGRRLWERPPEGIRQEEESAPGAASGGVRDPSGECGSQLDLSG